jgi:hypothetical protein
MRYYTGVWDKPILPGYSRPPVASKGERTMTWIGSGVGVVNVGIV